MTTPPEPNTDGSRFAYRTTTGFYVTDDSPVEVTMVFIENDPYAVHFVFDPLGARVTWTFARDLLTDCLAYRPSGPTMDVVITRTVKDVFVSLAGQKRDQPGTQSAVVIRIPSEVVREFLAMSFSLVRPGQESASVDWAEAEAVIGLYPGALTSS